jgi:hypothetical protein
MQTGTHRLSFLTVAYLWQVFPSRNFEQIILVKNSDVIEGNKEGKVVAVFN